MNDLELIDAVAKQTGEDSHEIRRRGFMLAGPEDASPEHNPECLFDLPEAGTVDCDALGFGCREPFLVSTLKARRKKPRTKTGVSVNPSVKKRAARAA
ncbi:MAG: hypothetical protein ACKO1M_00100 [Planctomycetota bacterium]